MRRLGTILKARKESIKNPHKYELERDKNLTADLDGAIEKNFEADLAEKPFNAKVAPDTKIKDDDIVFYSRLSKLLDEYDELKILSLSSRLAKSSDIRADDIHKHLHKATFLSNGAVHIDYIDVSKKYVRLVSNDLVAMYCYLSSEVKQELGDFVSDEVKALAEQFREKYLTDGQSLFSSDAGDFFVEQLKDILETIDRNTAIKEEDYWRFYDAIHLFLYDNIKEKSEDGEIWGFKNFCDIWESMCNTYLLENHPSDIVYVDGISAIMPDLNELIKDRDTIIDGCFGGEGQKRPDVVTFKNIGIDRAKRDTQVKFLENVFDGVMSDPIFSELTCHPYYFHKSDYRMIPSRKSHFTIWDISRRKICGEFDFGSIMQSFTFSREYHETKEILNFDIFCIDYLRQEFIKFKNNNEYDKNERVIVKKFFDSQIFSKFKDNNKLSIKEQINSRMLSFWELNNDCDFVHQLCATYLMRHVFWVAFSNDVNKNKFNYINFPEGFTICGEKDGNILIESELLRDFYRKNLVQDERLVWQWYGTEGSYHSPDELSDMYRTFCKSIDDLLSQYQIKLVTVVDAKYKSISSLINTTKNVKDNDFERQLKYKKIIQSKLCDREDIDLVSIDHEFWIPAYDLDPEKLEIAREKKRYPSDDEVELEVTIKSINFITIARNYIKNVEAT